MWSTMANLEAYQEYQRIEDFEEDSPPGEEDLLVHVPEGLKGTQRSSKHIFHVEMHTVQLVSKVLIIYSKNPTFRRVASDIVV